MKSLKLFICSCLFSLVGISANAEKSMDSSLFRCVLGDHALGPKWISTGHILISQDESTFLGLEGVVSSSVTGAVYNIADTNGHFLLLQIRVNGALFTEKLFDVKSEPQSVYFVGQQLNNEQYTFITCANK